MKRGRNLSSTNNYEIEQTYSSDADCWFVAENQKYWCQPKNASLF